MTDDAPDPDAGDDAEPESAGSDGEAVDEEREDAAPDAEPDGSATDSAADDAAAEADPDPTNERDAPGDADASGGFLGNLKGARSQLGDAREAFSTARSAGSLPTDAEGRVRIVCRRYEERRLVPLDDRGRPTCYEADHPDCEECVEAVREGSVGTW